MVILTKKKLEPKAQNGLIEDNSAPHESLLPVVSELEHRQTIRHTVTAKSKFQQLIVAYNYKTLVHVDKSVGILQINCYT